EGCDVVAQFGEGFDRCGDDGAAAATEVDQPVIAQLLVGVQHGVHIDVEGVSHFPRRGQAVAGHYSACDDLRAHRIRDLLEERAIAACVDADEHTLILLELELSGLPPLATRCSPGRPKMDGCRCSAASP